MTDYVIRMTFKINNGLIEKSTILETIEKYIELSTDSEVKATTFKNTIHRAWIELRTDVKSGMIGTIMIPIKGSSLSDAVLIADLIESIDRIGGYKVEFALVAITDIESVRGKMASRANTISEEPLKAEHSLPLRQQSAASSINKIFVKNISTYPFILGLIILVSSYVLLTQGETSYANVTALYAYYILAIGTIWKLALYLKDRFVNVNKELAP